MDPRKDINSNAAIKNIPRERVTDMRPPQERGMNTMRDNPVKRQDHGLIKHR